MTGLSETELSLLPGCNAEWRVLHEHPAEQPLFAQVEAGVFDATSYYRLNVVLLRLDPPA